MPRSTLNSASVVEKDSKDRWNFIRPFEVSYGDGTKQVIPPDFKFWATLGPTDKTNAVAVGVHDWVYAYNRLRKLKKEHQWPYESIPDKVTRVQADQKAQEFLKLYGASWFYRMVWRLARPTLFRKAWKHGIR